MTTSANSAIWSSAHGNLLEDRGLFYGDGLFETILVTGSQPRLLDHHISRLERSAEALGITMPGDLRAEVNRGLEESGVTEGVMKLVLSRRATSRGYAADAGAGTNSYVIVYGGKTQTSLAKPFEAKNLTRINVGLCRLSLARQPALAGHKHLNRLEQVLARSEWQRSDIDEALMLDTQGNLIEGTASNVFLVQGGVLRTPDLSHSGVAGVMRDWVLQQATAAGWVTEITQLSLSDLQRSDEVIMTNAVMGVRSVRNYIGLLPSTIDAASAELKIEKTFSDTRLCDRLAEQLAAVSSQQIPHL